MEHLKIIGIICLFTINCAQNKKTEYSTPDFFNSGTITITGHIANLGHNDSKTIFLKQFNILTRNDEVFSFKIDSHGNFEKVLPVFHPQELTFDYENGKVRLLVEQSDSLHLELDAQKPDQKVTFSGIGGNRNSLFNQYIPLASKVNREYARNVSGKELDFIVNEYNKTKEKLDSIATLVFKDNQPDHLLKNWIIAEKISLGIYDFVDYASMNEAFPATFLSSKNLIFEKDLNNQNYYCNRSYALDIFELYIKGCVFRENRELYQDALAHFKSDNYEAAIKLYADSIFKDFKHLGKDIVLYQSFRSILKKPNEWLGPEQNIGLLKKYYLQNLKNEHIKTLVLNTTYEQESTVSENLSTNTSEDILGSLMKKHKNKVLYIDISATWCGPCIGQLPYSVDLHKSLNDEEVVFVYLFAKSNLSHWKKIVSKYNLQGENLFISDEQYNFLLAKYKIKSGFPRYLIVNKNNQIVKNAARPSSNKIKEDILKLI